MAVIMDFEVLKIVQLLFEVYKTIAFYRNIKNCHSAEFVLAQWRKQYIQCNTFFRAPGNCGLRTKKKRSILIS